MPDGTLHAAALESSLLTRGWNAGRPVRVMARCSVASDTPRPRLLRSMGVQSLAVVRGCTLLATDRQGKPVIADQSVTARAGAMPVARRGRSRCLVLSRRSSRRCGLPLTAAAFRPGWLVGFGFGETKAALCF
jgi:hypothetical protein